MFRDRSSSKNVKLAYGLPTLVCNVKNQHCGEVSVLSFQFDSDNYWNIKAERVKLRVEVAYMPTIYDKQRAKNYEPEDYI
jgi:hypothetical protein